MTGPKRLSAIPRDPSVKKGRMIVVVRNRLRGSVRNSRREGAIRTSRYASTHTLPLSPLGVPLTETSDRAGARRRPGAAMHRRKPVTMWPKFGVSTPPQHRQAGRCLGSGWRRGDSRIPPLPTLTHSICTNSSGLAGEWYRDRHRAHRAVDGMHALKGLRIKRLPGWAFHCAVSVMIRCSFPRPPARSPSGPPVGPWSRRPRKGPPRIPAAGSRPLRFESTPVRQARGALPGDLSLHLTTPFKDPV